MNDAGTANELSPEGECSGQPVVVLGVDRSGTSMVASMIHRWGAYGGEDASLRAGNEGNPRGYFEHRPMQAFLLHWLGTDFWVPEYETGLRKLAADPQVRALALALMDEMRRGGDVWFWKDPLLSVTLPFWESLWASRVAYVVLLRDPWKCALSWQRLSLPPAVRARIDLQAAGLLRWQVFMLSILKVVEGHRQSLFLRYETVLSSPEEQGRRLASFLDRWSGREPTSEQGLLGMTELVEPRLDRTECSVEFAVRDQVTADQKYLWTHLCQKARDLDMRLDFERSAPWPGWREYLDNLREFWLLYERSAPLLESRWAARALKIERLMKTMPLRLFRTDRGALQRA